jgi:hypothetical protein
MTAPTSFRYPTRTKVIIAVVLALAIGGFVLAGLSADTDGNEAVTLTGGPGQASSSDGVVAIAPGDGSEALAQQPFSIQLANGWTGQLTFLPGNGSAVPLPPDEVQVTALNELVYQPAEGKAVERLPQGTSCVIATIWDQVRGRDASERSETWCFEVT